jgi:GDP/UDP-N,N'-diacetylbacillosamine 2-epimerase (hydrolysing)
MKYATAVVGNSSSGLIEAPSLSVPVINIGDRQKGRLQSDNVINCGNNESQIKEAFGKLESLKIQNKKSLFDGGNTSKKIIKIIRKLNFDTLLQKSFHDIPTKSEKL